MENKTNMKYIDTWGLYPCFQGTNDEIIGKSLMGKIVDVNWHIKKDAPMYFVETDGKKNGKRYWDYDLRAIK